MHLRPLNPDTIRKIALFVQGLRLWTLELVALWVKLFGTRAGRIDLRCKLRDLRRQTRAVFMIAVAARIRVLDRPIATTRPRSFRPGTRYQLRRTRWLRLLTRRIRLETLADIRAALDDFDAHVARAYARLPKRFLVGVLVMTFAVADLRDALCDAHETLAPDTS